MGEAIAFFPAWTPLGHDHVLQYQAIGVCVCVCFVQVRMTRAGCIQRMRRVVQHAVVIRRSVDRRFQVPPASTCVPQTHTVPLILITRHKRTITTMTLHSMAVLTMRVLTMDSHSVQRPRHPLPWWRTLIELHEEDLSLPSRTSYQSQVRISISQSIIQSGIFKEV